MLLCGPRILLMLPVWLLGVLGHRLTRRRPLPRLAGLGLWVGSVVALGALAAWQVQRGDACAAHKDCFLLAAFGRSLFDWQEYLADYLIGALVLANFMGFLYCSDYFERLVALVRNPVRWLAGATFTLYLLHYPVAQFLIAVSPWGLGTRQQQIFVYGVTLAVSFGVAQVTERRKDVLRQPFEQMAGYLKARLIPA
jgi:peptidoglycan/LPS O-acetylase OafA/YrhL